MNKRPLFLVPERNPIVKSWKQVFQKFEQGADELEFTVNPTTIAEGQVARVQQMVIALQHCPRLIERMIFSVTFKFMLLDDVSIEVRGDAWKTNAVYRWFYALSALPPVIYFINDQDARDYCLFGDILAKRDFNCRQGKSDADLIAELTEEERQGIADRLFRSSLSLLMYCHGSGFTPDKYIDALLADYDMPFTAADVKRQYDENIERGINFRMVQQG